MVICQLFCWRDLVVKLYSTNQVTFFPDSIDYPLKRYWIILLSDNRIIENGLNNISTPFLDTQINIVLLLLVLFFISFKYFSKDNCIINKSNKFFKINSFIFCSLLLFLTTLLSSSSRIFKILPKIFSIIQFNYRMVTYQNLSIFIILIMMFFYYKINFDQKIFSRILITILIVISFSNVLIKIDHASLIKDSISLSKPISMENISKFNKALYYPYSINDFESFPSTFYYTSAYTNRIEIPAIENSISGDLNFELLDHPFGKVESEKNIDAIKTGWYLTNISRFKWNRVTVDDKLLEKKYILGSEEGNLVIYLERGNHSISASFDPPKVFKVLWYISIYSVYSSLTILILLNIIDLIKKILHLFKIKSHKNTNNLLS